MNACEAEILRLTKYEPRTKQKYKNRNEYLTILLMRLDMLPADKLEHLVSEQVYDWFRRATAKFKGYRPLPELPDIPAEELRYPIDQYKLTEIPEVEMPSEGSILELIEARERLDEALQAVQRATEKVRAKRYSKYRPAHPLEGARYYLFAEADQYGLIIGSMRHQAATMFERGATMPEVTKACGYPMYNLLRMMRERGHRVVNAGGLYTLIHKDLVEMKK